MTLSPGQVFSGLERCPIYQRLQVWFPVRHIPKFQVLSPFGCVWEATDCCFSYIDVFLSCSPSLTLPLSLE